MRITITGVEQVNEALTRLGDVQWEKPQSDVASKMKNDSDSVAPIDTGALRQSATFDDGEFGYTVDYAAHVNYGHRTRGGGYVEGQHFLEEVVNRNEEEYKEAVLRSLKESVL